MVPYYKIWNTVKELVVACHMDETGQPWYQFTFGTQTQPSGDAIEFFGDNVNKSPSSSEENKLSKNRYSTTRKKRIETKSSEFSLMCSGSESTSIAIFVLNVIYGLIYKLKCFFDLSSPSAQRISCLSPPI